MNKLKIAEIAQEVLEHWEGPSQYKNVVPIWDGPSGQYWCKQKNKLVNPNKCDDCPECEAISQLDIHPPRYLHPTEMSW